MKRTKTRAAIGIVAVLALLVSATVSFAAGGGETPRSVAATPEGFEKYLVYLGESVAEPGESSLFMDAEAVETFQNDIMGRTEEEETADRDAAEAFFKQRFGLDFTGTEPDESGTQTIDGAKFFGFMQNPDANYRAYTVSGDWVPPEGWMVRDGGWGVMLTEGQLVHGDYGGAGGKWVDEGAMVVFGNYNIKVERPNSKAGPHAGETIIIHYESGGPIIADADGVTSFICDLSHPDWGEGKARGVAVDGVIRNVLTFPSDLQ